LHISIYLINLRLLFFSLLLSFFAKFLFIKIPDAKLRFSRQDLSGELISKIKPYFKGDYFEVNVAKSFTGELDIPIEVIWDFIRDADNWAPLVPGYIFHEAPNDSQIIWEFKSDLGIVKKKVTLLIDFKEWNEPNMVSFELKRKNEKYVGEGYLEAKALNKNKITFTNLIEREHDLSSEQIEKLSYHLQKENQIQGAWSKDKKQFLNLKEIKLLPWFS